MGEETVFSTIAGIDELKGACRAQGTPAPERLSALRRVATIESIGSSTQIEGSKLSDRGVEREKLVLGRLPRLALQIVEFTSEHGH